MITGWVHEAISGTYKNLSTREHKEMGMRAHDTRGMTASPFLTLPGVTFAKYYLQDLHNLNSLAILTAADKNR